MFSNILRYDFKMLFIIFFQECYKYLLLPLINTYKFLSSSCTHMSSNKNVKNLFNKMGCVCVCVCTRTRVCIHMYIYTHIHITYIHTYARACIHTHIHIRDHNNNDYITVAIVHSTSKIQIRR